MDLKFSQEVLEKYPSLKTTDFATPFFKDGRDTRLLEWIYARPDLDTLRGDPARVCAAIEEYSGQHELLLNVGSTKADLINNLIAAQKPQVIVEMGCYVGYSAISFASAMRSQHPASTKLQFWSLEFNLSFASVATKLVELAGLSDVVTIVIGAAGDSVKQLAQENKLDHIDMLFIDHMAENYHTDFQICESLNLFKSGSQIVADNILVPGAPKYAEYVRNHPKFESKTVKCLHVPGDLEDEIEITRVI
ncbi:Catechol O-methyltransferase [Mycena indigotica]|uniref:catechol O-methyltransferase n=1 Tax=Mycena indigotica TaxID=2126181 RepID=A0A8H6TD75_9AGAR|nr:Catechol O-methyltransferase [Mycena indigotica]KAF7316438.1 Catechol O-methyltransferase [Mycena indigotica]